MSLYWDTVSQPEPLTWQRKSDNSLARYEAEGRSGRSPSQSSRKPYGKGRAFHQILSWAILDSLGGERLSPPNALARVPTSLLAEVLTRELEATAVLKPKNHFGPRLFISLAGRQRPERLDCL